MIVLALILAQSIASFIVEVAWWRELNQLPTWQSILLYRVAPISIAALIAFITLWIAHARGLKHAGTGLGQYPLYGRLSTVVLFLLGIFISQVSLDSWTFVSYAGSMRAGVPAGVWTDPIFGRSLTFYMFELPMYYQLLGFVTTLTLAAAIIYFVASRVVALFHAVRDSRGEMVSFDFGDIGALFASRFIRTFVAVALLSVAARIALDRYAFLYEDHGFLVGIDYVADKIKVPLLWVGVAAFCFGAVMVVLGRWKLASVAILALVLRAIVPPIVSVVYVKPNELTLQQPYIEHHIRSTRAAWGLDKRLTETQHPAKLEAPVSLAANRALLENVRLWDWRAFHDTVTQLQALRQYYVFADTDVDRYTIDGNIRQVMLTPRELDIRQLADARGNWLNSRFIYTHGYGLVMASASQLTSNGQPVFYMHDAPPRVETQSLKLTRPEIYFGEVTHEPVFVNTGQKEFNYPSGSGNVETRYAGNGGIPVGNFGMRLAAAIKYADRNLLFTNYLTSGSRMMINRDVTERVQKLASFIEWDPDPYLVVRENGSLVWMVDGYTSTWRHPYSRRIRLGSLDSVNYVRNSVKAVVDAYDGSVSMYIYDVNDPVIRAFDAMFPALFTPGSQMPADLRSHVRYPELLFRGQAEIYRAFHMTDPAVFYNREDLWDIAKQVAGQSKEAEALAPTYIVGSLPGQTQPEFLLIQPFTPRSKDNLIGLMIARSDGEHFGEIQVLQLSKQSLIYGPLQIEARIDSDQNISKDLSLWNQQGSQVLRGQMLVLPAGDTFVYVEPIYIQSAQAKMPQLRKVVIANGNTLIYRDTYEQALAELTGGQIGTAPAPTTEGTAAPAEQAPPATPGTQPPPVQQTSTGGTDPRVQRIREHFRRYRELASQGRWADAGRELEAAEKLAAQ